MKILIVSQYFYPETFRVNTLARELVERGNQVTVLTGYPQYPQGEIYEGFGFKTPYEKQWKSVRIERIKMRPRGHNAIGLLRNCTSFVTQGYKWVRKCKEKFDAVYVFEVSPVTVGLPAIQYKKKFGTPVFFNVLDLWPENVEEVLGIHNKLVIGVINRIVNKIYKHSDKILCPSEGFVENIAARGIGREKLVYWPQFCLEPSLNQAQRPECYGGDACNIVFAGNIGDAQGLDLLVECAEKLKNDPVRWHIVGDGRAKERLESVVAEKQLTDCVNFVGKVSEAEANIYVKYADAAYLSFKKSKLFDLTIPAKMQTYLACGTPILCAAGGQSAKIVEAADCGFVCDQNAEEIAQTVKKILVSDKLAKMGENARNYFEGHFDMGLLVDKLEQMMRGVSQ